MIRLAAGCAFLLLLSESAAAQWAEEVRAAGKFVPPKIKTETLRKKVEGLRNAEDDTAAEG